MYIINKVNMFSGKNVNNLMRVSAVIAVILVIIAILYKGIGMIRLVRADNAVSGQEAFAPVSDGAVEFKTERPEYEKPSGPTSVLLPDGAPYSDLLPDGGEDESPSALLSKISFLDATSHAGVDTIGSSLKIASHDLRRSPPNPLKVVAPWNMSSSLPNPFRKALDM